VPTTDEGYLATDHYAPASGGRLYPTILIRTPYGRTPSSGPTGLGTAFAARRFAERGYNVIVQDVRGRYDSPGEFVHFSMNSPMAGPHWIGWKGSFGSTVCWECGGQATSAMYNGRSRPDRRFISKH